jgi:hypothetical protein
MCLAILTGGPSLAAEPTAELRRQLTPAPPTERPALAQEASVRLKQVFASDEFRDSELRNVLHRKHAQPQPQSPGLPAWLQQLIDWLASLAGAGHFLADLGSVLLWLAALLAVLALIATRARWLPYFGRQSAPAPRQSTAAVAIALDAAQVLPKDVAAAAQCAWQNGQTVLALSLLYRGALQRAAGRLAVQLPAGATENEALRALERADPPLRDYLAVLTRAWLALAYAGRPPNDFEGLLAGYRSHLPGVPS